MARSTSKFVCQNCNYQSAKWLGRCPDCGTWNGFVETVSIGKKSSTSTKFTGVKSVNLFSVSAKKTSRVKTKISELDRVLGGGLVAGQVILLAGEPGIGKSTILLQLAEKLGNCLYVSGEESALQIKLRAIRLGSKNKSIEILETTDVDSITSQMFNLKDQKLVVVDSIQTMTTSDLSGMPGSVGQVRESAGRLVKAAKQTNTPVVIVGHVTKAGSVAGPATLAHMVDTVLWFEGDKSLVLRLLRAVKNRFGTTDEVGIFEMREKGLIPITNTDKLFLSKTRKQIAGSCVTSILEGTRPFLVEVQSLVVPTKMAFAKRVAQGYDAKRLELILAVLQRRAGMPIYNFDVFVNIAGGIKVKEPSADLAIALSIASAYFDKPLPKALLAIGEVGLLGEIREVSAQEKRVREARRVGFSTLVSNKEVKYLGQAIKKHLR